MKRIADFSEEQIVSRSYPSCRTVRLQHSGDAPLLHLAHLGYGRWIF